MIRAVICDDEKAAAKIIRHFIEMEHLPIDIVGTAENGRDAWNLIKNEKPDLVFMDIHMPYMTGFEIIQKIKNAKVIIITAYDSFEYAQRALRLGASDILSKPIELEQLKQAISRAVGREYTTNERVNTVLAHLYDHYAEKIELRDLAQLAYCSEEHIARLFKQHTDMSIVSFLHKIRVEKSIELMSRESFSIKEAAEQVGYQNLNNYYKYFKIYAGMTPAQFLKQRGLQTNED